MIKWFTAPIWSWTYGYDTFRIKRLWDANSAALALSPFCSPTWARSPSSPHKTAGEPARSACDWQNRPAGQNSRGIATGDQRYPPPFFVRNVLSQPVSNKTLKFKREHERVQEKRACIQVQRGLYQTGSYLNSLTSTNIESSTSNFLPSSALEVFER